MANGFRTIPSAIAQQAALAQLREIQNPNLALERQIQQAIEMQRIQQQSPENQLALQIKQAQLASQLEAAPLERQRQQLIVQELQNQLDPNYQAAQDARKLAFEVNKARQIADATSKGQKGFFYPEQGVWIKEVNGKPVASRIPFEETEVTSAPTASASDIPSIDPALFSGTPNEVTPIIPPTPSARTLTGTLEQKAKTAEELKREDREFREQLQKDDQKFRSEENKLQREFLKGKDEAKPPKPLPVSISNRISDATTAIDNLITLKSYIDSPAVKSISGPAYGRTFGANPFSVTAGNFAGIRGTSKQSIGKYLEGGVLREADERKYEKIIPGLTMLPEVQTNQANELYGTLRKKLTNDILSYERSGYDVSNLKDSLIRLDAQFSGSIPRSSSGKASSPVATPGINPNAPAPIQIRSIRLKE